MGDPKDQVRAVFANICSEMKNMGACLDRFWLMLCVWLLHGDTNTQQRVYIFTYCFHLPLPSWIAKSI